MQLTLVAGITYFGPDARIDTFHSAMFHGVERRRNKEDVGLNLIEYPLGPLVLVLNDFRINPIIQPRLNLIATAEVAETFTRHCDVKLVDVEIEGVATVEYAEGSMKHWDDPRYRDKGGTPERILQRRAAREKRKWTGPMLKEIVPHDGEAVRAKSPDDAFDLTVEFKRNGDNLRVVGSKRGLREIGLLWSDGVHCFDAARFEHFREFFHPDYFEVIHVNV